MLILWEGIILNNWCRLFKFNNRWYFRVVELPKGIMKYPEEYISEQ
jgi:hypothetical protein